MDVARWAGLARQVLQARGVKGETEVSLLFVDEDAIAALNEQFLGKTGPTDVLSFPIEDEPGPTGRSPDFGGSGPGSSAEQGILTLLGDVVICPVVAARNAVEHEVSFEDEVALLVVHGLLHLLGMDHEKEAEAERMEAVEQQLLTRFHRVTTEHERAHAPGRIGVSCRGRHPHRHHRHPARGFGRPGHGRDEPRADEPDQGQVAGGREEARRPSAGPVGREPGQLPQSRYCCWC